MQLAIPFDAKFSQFTFKFISSSFRLCSSLSVASWCKCDDSIHFDVKLSTIVIVMWIRFPIVTYLQSKASSTFSSRFVPFEYSSHTKLFPFRSAIVNAWMSIANEMQFYRVIKSFLQFAQQHFPVRGAFKSTKPVTNGKLSTMIICIMGMKICCQVVVALIPLVKM